MIIKCSLKIDLIMPEPHNVKFPTPHPHGPTTTLTIVLCHHYYRPKLRRFCFYRGGAPGPWGVSAPGEGVSAPGRGGGVPACTEADTPRDRRPLLRTVRILLECILVSRSNCSHRYTRSCPAAHHRHSFL